MGELPGTVFNVGSPAMDGLRHVVPDADAPEVIVMQHPVGGSDRDERRWMTHTLRATQRYRRLILAPNADPGSAGIRAAIRASGHAMAEHLPHQRFRALLAGCGAIAGNSSAGLIEAAGLGVPCVNIGPRQSGRERPGNVVDCSYGETSVRRAVAKAMALRRGRLRHPYGNGRTGQRIATLLATINLSKIPTRKHNAY
jgi:UDP-N-acetylglucosamine 2-epimerase